MPVDADILSKLREHNDGGRLDDVISGYLSRKYDVGIIEFVGNGLQVMRDAVARKRDEFVAAEPAQQHSLHAELEAYEASLAEAERYYARPRIVITERLPEPDENIVHLQFSSRRAPPLIGATNIEQQQHPHDQAGFEGNA